MLVGVYFALAIYAWLDFVRLPKDGLANLGLMLVTFPISFVGVVLTELFDADDFILLPRGFGYFEDHALYYWPAVVATALLLYWVCAAVGRLKR